ncbi:hypothetical protein B0H13DRAFT_1918127 [Mycena leptocephala]|nr:hypothetical protein B0H13DRAFT_1918127 [Mycena leptocephala]
MRAPGKQWRRIRVVPALGATNSIRDLSLNLRWEVSSKQLREVMAVASPWRKWSVITTYSGTSRKRPKSRTHSPFKDLRDARHRNKSWSVTRTMRLSVSRLVDKDERDAKLRKCDDGKATRGTMSPSRSREAKVTLERRFPMRDCRVLVRTSNCLVLNSTGGVVIVGGVARVDRWRVQLVQPEQRAMDESASCTSSALDTWQPKLLSRVECHGTVGQMEAELERFVNDGAISKIWLGHCTSGGGWIQKTLLS